MKRDPWAGVLTVVLVASTLGAAAKCYQYLRVAGQNRYVNEQAAQVNQRRALLNAFGAELTDYAKAHPSIEPVLNQISMRSQTITNSAPKAP